MPLTSMSYRPVIITIYPAAGHDKNQSPEDVRGFNVMNSFEDVILMTVLVYLGRQTYCHGVTANELQQRTLELDRSKACDLP